VISKILQLLEESCGCMVMGISELCNKLDAVVILHHHRPAAAATATTTITIITTTTTTTNNTNTNTNTTTTTITTSSSSGGGNFMLLILCIFLQLIQKLTNALNKIQIMNCILLCAFVTGCINRSSCELIIRQFYLLFLSSLLYGFVLWRTLLISGRIGVVK